MRRIQIITLSAVQIITLRSKHAPRVPVFAAYWPQWHATPLNDYWFGKGFTDWQLLCDSVHKARHCFAPATTTA